MRRMNWLLTYCDGCSGYKSSDLLTYAGAFGYLTKVEGLDDEEAENVLDDQDGTCRNAYRCDESEAVLYPVPFEATDTSSAEEELETEEEEG